jgi:hypothetical protein
MLRLKYGSNAGNVSLTIPLLAWSPTPRIASTHRDNGQAQLVLQVFYFVLHRLDCGLGIAIVEIQNIVGNICLIGPLTH